MTTETYAGEPDNPSVLRKWVMQLPLRAQGTLLTAIRGCDLTPKFPLDSNARKLVAAIRYAVMNPFDIREVDSEPGCFMISSPPTFKPSEFGHLPQHWYAHVMHSCEIIGYMHPDNQVKEVYKRVYLSFVRSLHLEPETKEKMIERLTEDRIASGEIVS